MNVAVNWNRRSLLLLSGELILLFDSFPAKDLDVPHKLNWEKHVKENLRWKFIV